MSQDEKAQRASTSRTSIEAILEQWRRERPDINPCPMAVCGELKRAAERIRLGIVANLSGTQLDLAGFDVLLTLRRQGKGCSLSPSELAREMMLSSSAMTSCLDRLEKNTLIKRKSDPKDRRGLKILLTSKGFALADQLVVTHIEAENQMLKDLTKREIEQLRNLLHKLSSPS
ncbi:MAG: MarR family transcriptional regulator [Rhodospirillaceae bacterium]|nr:MAG: MarR family transcriptional regulator [Rhodospirillaceae bacterium]